MEPINRNLGFFLGGGVEYQTNIFGTRICELPWKKIIYSECLCQANLFQINVVKHKLEVVKWTS